MHLYRGVLQYLAVCLGPCLRVLVPCQLIRVSKRGRASRPLSLQLCLNDEVFRVVSGACVPCRMACLLSQTAMHLLADTFWCESMAACVPRASSFASMPDVVPVPV